MAGQRGQRSITSARAVAYAVDGVVAVGLVVVTGVATAHGLPGAPPMGAALLGVAAAATVPARRLHPTVVFVASTVLAQAYLAATGSEAGILILTAPLIVLYTLARQDGWRWAALLGGVALLTIFALHATLRPEWAGPQNVALLALGGFAVAAGAANRSHRAYIAAVEARARQAEQAMEQEAERRVTEERLRIARELHDVLGHHLALITVHAGAAADVLDANPTDARRSLEHIGRAGRTALAELRDVVVLLRGPGEPATPTEPAGGLARLDELLAACRRSGLCVDHSVSGTPRALSAAVDLAAFRVVQEALTNVAKHAHGSAAALRLRYERDRLTIVVEDDGPGSTAAPERGEGHGLDGMRERVSAVGGSFEAGPRPGAGFRVTARLPVGPGAPAAECRA